MDILEGLLEMWYLCAGLSLIVALAYPVVVLQEMLDVVDDVCDIEFGLGII